MEVSKKVLWRDPLGVRTKIEGEVGRGVGYLLVGKDKVGMVGGPRGIV